MNDLKNIKKESVLSALEIIDENPSLKNGRKSTTYDLIHDGKTYPPILVLSESNKFEGGGELTLSDFNNDTTKAFKKLEELGFKVEQKGQSFKQISKKIGTKTAEKYFASLKHLVDRLDVKRGDERLVFSIRPDKNRLVFIIGQRYCFILEAKTENMWGFISTSEISELKSSSFDGSPLAFWNETQSFDDVNNFFEDVIEACQTELDRSNKSSYRKFNNAEFEEAVYNGEHEMDLFDIPANDKSESFKETLQKFLKQAETSNIKTKHYRNSYNGLEVNVSFGQGYPAKIPWISFLHETQTTSHGIYPVYLLYKQQNILILAYGISEKNKPDYDWNLKEAAETISIREYFEKNDLGRPYRYGSSFVYKVYDLQKGINNYSIDNDLSELTNKYKQIMEGIESPTFSIPFDIKLLGDSLNNSSLVYNSLLVEKFSIGLATKPFLILTGLSGSGKTKLAQSFSKWIIEEKSQLNLVPVGADWTNREPLLGYPNALEVGKYVLPETGVLQLILRAIKDPDRPYLLILDEMNLSHVERYFADFLSAIESGEEIKLHSGNGSWEEEGYQIPPALTIPKNLFIIGTVNIDETTYMFSPKVLDRANVIEFRVSEKEMDKFLKNPSDVDLSELESKGAGMAKDFVKIATHPAADYSDKEILSKELIQFFGNLSEVGAEFGYRTANEISRFASLAEQLAEDWEFEQIMDAAISQKLLPKLHGSRRKLEGVLFKLAMLCIKEGDAEGLLKKPSDIDWETNVKYPISLEKIIRMHKGLLENGFTSFAEA